MVLKATIYFLSALRYLYEAAINCYGFFGFDIGRFLKIIDIINKHILLSILNLPA